MTIYGSVAVTDRILTLSASAFKARCLAIFKELEARRLSHVVITRRGRPVARLTPAGEAPPALWGAHRGSVEVMPGVDLTEPLDEELDATEGILHR
jgi:hypothetical protein